MGQRGNAVPWLTGALFSLGKEEEFVRSLQVLADGLGVDPADPRSTVRGEASRQPATDHEPGVGSHDPVEETPEEWTLEIDEEKRPVSAVASSNRPITPKSDGPVSSAWRAEPDNGGDTQNVRPAQPISTGRRAADHFGIVVARRGQEGPGASNAGPVRETFRDDHRARQAVIQYETHCGRRAEAMDDLQPGFDVLSVDKVTGHQRRIEVKGVQGDFEADASVVLTARQAHDAVQHSEDGVAYWLYVVDSTETDRPRVFPIPWVRRPALLRYGFYARVWVGAAERPAAVTADGLIDLSSQAKGS